jgi:hypothetical protein
MRCCSSSLIGRLRDKHRRVVMMPARDIAIPQMIVSARASSKRPLSPVRLPATILLTLAIACTIATNAALAQQIYLGDIKEKSPRIITKWQSIIPGPFAATAWIRSLDGLSPPIDDLVISYKRFYLGWVCSPRDCVENRVVFLIAQDGSEAYGMLRSKMLNADDLFFGAPSGEHRERLKGYLDK